MTDNTQPEALRLAEQYDHGDPATHGNAWKAAICAELRRQHARIAELAARVQELGAMARENRSRRIVELEAQLKAAGAGGVQALSAAPAVPAGWVERWHGSGGKEFWEGWSILNAANREMIAHLGPDVDPDAVRDIVAAHNEALCGECAGTGGRWCPACAGATPPAEQQATKETSGGFHVWRDISTAPKDGSRFVATGHNYGLYSEVRHTCVAQWFRGCWMEASDWNETSELKYLTHWMPLPPLPGNAARKQGVNHD